MREIRFHKALTIVLMGAVLGLASSCGGGSSSSSSNGGNGNGGDGSSPVPEGLGTGHIRALVENGYDTTPTTEVAAGRQAAYDLQEAAADNWVENTDTSSLTQGGARTNPTTDGTDNPPADTNRTNDRVGFTTYDGTTGVPASLRINVGNDGSGNLTSTVNPAMATPTATTDRRGTSLGTTGDISDPAWAYGTRMYRLGTGNAAGEFDAYVVDWSTATGNYVGGGVWTRVIDISNVLTLVTGAFVDGTEATSGGHVTEAAGTATYRGHSYGRYSVLPAVNTLRTSVVEDNAGFFAAKATLTADFGTTDDAGGTISGEITDFLFSTSSGFTGESVLEDAIGAGATDADDRLRITLRGETVSGIPTATATINGNRAEGGTLGTVPVGPRNTRTTLTLTGRWGGRFYGLRARESYLPPIFAGTWGAEGTSGDPARNGLGLSFIGAFSTRFDYGLGADLTGAPFAPAAPNDSYANIAEAARSAPIFGNGGGTSAASALTQGSTQGSSTTTSVSVTVDGANGAATLVINVGGTALTATTQPDTGTRTPDLAPARLMTGLDSLGGGTDTSDPQFNYTRRGAVGGTLRRNGGTAPRGDGEYAVLLVDWNAATGTDNNYMTGGVWARGTNGNEAGVEGGAFIDGVDPTETSELNAITPTNATATYRGHSFGTYVFNNNIIKNSTLPSPGTTPEIGPGFFASRARLTADFGADTIEGELNDFRFSDNEDSEFLDEINILEAAIGGETGMRVALNTAPISGNSFTGETASSLRTATGDIIDLAGQWGGRFYGSPALNSGDVPATVGGTFGVSGASGTTPADVGFSLIGTFGAAQDTTP